jgi:hypothetical protein
MDEKGETYSGLAKLLLLLLTASSVGGGGGTADELSEINS